MQGIYEHHMRQEHKHHRTIKPGLLERGVIAQNDSPAESIYRTQENDRRH